MIERTPEQHEILGAFLDMLEGVIGDGANKRAAGLKPFWKVDTGHPAAAGRHRARYADGQRYDADSGCHHLIHCAARDLMTAYQDMMDDGLVPADPRPQAQETQPGTVSGVSGASSLRRMEDPYGPPTVEAGAAH